MCYIQAAGYLGPYAPGQGPTPKKPVAGSNKRIRDYDSASDNDSDDDSDAEGVVKKRVATGASPGAGEPDSSIPDVDPRLLDYDDDTHAEMLALGMQMRRHTTAKALIDARCVRVADCRW